eukprot:TRINITY_DN25023_c0_g1_i2.p1 TRINITY_DN25023_c0_g1~~TRINITY_DN25023_c0_g1_i2.p1  ORF type:complete len:423 (-),score=97.74 TRINITY_DN25023_c0_g1_i2:104-1372(-)
MKWKVSSASPGKAQKDVKLLVPSAAVFARLHNLLSRLPPESRRSVLETRFSQSQRILLERWILAMRGTGDCGSKQGGQSALRMKVAHSEGKRVRAMASAAAFQKRHRSAESGEPGNWTKLEAPTAAAGEGPAVLQGSGLSECWRFTGEMRVPGVTQNLQAQGCFYSAHVVMGAGLVLLSKADRRLAVALGFREVLLDIRRRAIVEQADVGQVAFEERFRQAVRHVLAERGLAAEDLGLRFKVSLRPLWSSRPLCTRAYRCWARSLPDSAEMVGHQGDLGEMDLGLKAWRCLREAAAPEEKACTSRRGRSHVLCRATPPQLRSLGARLQAAYQAVMEEAGFTSSWIQARLEELRSEQLEAEEKQAEHWNRTRMAREELHQAAVRREEQRREQQASREAQRLHKRSAFAARAERAIGRLLRRAE